MLFLGSFQLFIVWFSKLTKRVSFAEEIIVLKTEWRKTENWEKDTGKILM